MTIRTCKADPFGCECRSCRKFTTKRQVQHALTHHNRMAATMRQPLTREVLSASDREVLSVIREANHRIVGDRQIA